MDLKTGTILQPILENASEGVCTIHADFTKVSDLFLWMTFYFYIVTMLSLGNFRTEIFLMVVIRVIFHVSDRNAFCCIFFIFIPV